MTPLHIVVIGAGIVGLATAASAARRGHRVTLCERSKSASGASVRNFGMVWPIGQPAGARRAMALEGSLHWARLAREAGVWMNPCGALFLAHCDEEWGVLSEFAGQGEILGVTCELLDAQRTLARSPAVNPHELRGGLFTPHEAAVDPRDAIPALARWLALRYDVNLRFGATAVLAESGGVRLADGTSISADRVVICSGADTDTLFPGELGAAGLRRCKLHMMSTTPQPAGFSVGPLLAGGLSLRHYPIFASCASLGALRTRVARELPACDRFGIHVMASQNEAGEMVLGDSHEYGDEAGLFDRTEIDELVLSELRRILVLPSWKLSRRWTGVYLQHPELPYTLLTPTPHVHLFTGFGGGGMTLAFAAAEREWDRILG